MFDPSMEILVNHQNYLLTRVGNGTGNAIDLPTCAHAVFNTSGEYVELFENCEGLEWHPTVCARPGSPFRFMAIYQV